MANRDQLMARFIASHPKPGKRYVKGALKRGRKATEDPRRRDEQRVKA